MTETEPTETTETKIEAPQITRTHGETLEGSIKFWLVDKGFGFVTCDDGGELFCHRKALKLDGEKFQAVLPGTRVAVKVLVQDGKQSVEECTGPAGALLPGFTSKQEAAHASSVYKPGMLTGTIKFMSTEKGYGFIIPDGEDKTDVFLHKDDVLDGRILSKEEPVCYKLGTKKEGGKEQAVSVSSMRQPTPLMLQQPAQYGLYDQPVFASQAALPAPSQPYGGLLQQSQFQGGGGGGDSVGTVKWYNESKKFGFIIPQHGGKDIYFKGDDVQGAMVQPGQTVRYQAQQMGDKPQAFGVSPSAPMGHNLKRKAEQMPYQMEPKRFGEQPQYQQQQQLLPQTGFNPYLRQQPTYGGMY